MNDLGKNLLRFDYAQEYLLLDFETEGLNLFFSRPWQASFIHFTLNKILASHDYYILIPDLKISDGAKRITKFNMQDYLSKAVSPQEVLNTLLSYVNNPKIRVVWQNGLRFDSMIFAILCRMCGVKPDFSFIERSIDTAVLSKLMFQKYNIDKEDFVAQQYRIADMRMGKDADGKIIRTSLSAMAEYFKIDFDPEKLHNALYDGNINIDVFRKQLLHIEI